MRFLIVGAGITGAVCARELMDLGHEVIVVDRRNHIGGNCYTETDSDTGIHVHRYGPHFFHTNDRKIWEYVNRFARFSDFRYQAAAKYKGRMYSFPINLTTLRQVCGIRSVAEAKHYLSQFGSPLPTANLEEYCLTTIGPELYDMFIRGYTTKQWGCEPRELPATIIRRLPIRFHSNNCYFDDQYQGLPVGGYTAMMERLLQGANITLGVDFISNQNEYMRDCDHTIYTGSIDELCNYQFGELDYRSLKFEFRRVGNSEAQKRPVINHTDLSVPYTRSVNHMRLTPHYNGNGKDTIVSFEHPCRWSAGAERCYPIGTQANRDLYERYKALCASRFRALTLAGRLGTYRYLDMHQAIAAAQTTVKRVTGNC